MAALVNKSFLNKARRAKVRSPHTFFGAVDIETNQSEKQLPGTTALGGDCVILTYAYESPVNKISKKTGKKSHRKQKRKIISGYVNSWSEFFELLENDTFLRSVCWFAHNMEFDLARAHDEFAYMIENDFEIKPIINGLGKFISLVCYDSQGEKFFSIRDSMAVINSTLDAVTDNLAPEFKKLTGVINFNKEQFDIQNELHREYALMDSIGLLNAMINLELMLIQNFGVKLRLTAASIALQAFRITLGGQFYDVCNKTLRDYQRQAYYGGFVFCGRRTGETITGPLFHYDFSSAYPFVMRAFGVPFGRPKKTYEYKAGDIGIYRVKVTIEDHHLPVIPLRTKNGVLWPRGSFETNISSVDIENAAMQGIKIEVIEGVQFERLCFPFKTIIDKCEAMRKAHKGTALEMLAKLIQNSLYGKFASREELNEVIFSKVEKEGFSSFDESFNDNTINDFDSISLDIYRQTKTKNLDEDYLIIAWSVFITAQARKHLHSHMLIAGIDNVFYGDTDSIVVNETGKNNLEAMELVREKAACEYGDLVLENIYVKFIVIAPKVYAGLNDKGKLCGKAKGIPKKKRDDEFFEGILEGLEIPEITFESVASLNSVLKGGNYSTIRKRGLSQFENCAGWKLTEHGVLSIHITQARNVTKYIPLAA